jgi:predicted AAA+ superfamily ATPase
LSFIFGAKVNEFLSLSNDKIVFLINTLINSLSLKNSSPYMPENLYFWTREKEKSHAEVDYLIQRSDIIVPVEVKSGKSGKMQSLHLFINEKQARYGIRTSLENFCEYDKIRVYPLYAIGNV